MVHDQEQFHARLPLRPRRSKCALAVRMMVGEMAWLTGHPHWQAGRVAWTDGTGLVVPETGDFVRAQRRLYKLRRFPVSADLALGDGQAWLSEHPAHPPAGRGVPDAKLVDKPMQPDTHATSSTQRCHKRLPTQCCFVVGKLAYQIVCALHRHRVPRVY